MLSNQDGDVVQYLILEIIYLLTIGEIKLVFIKSPPLNGIKWFLDTIMQRCYTILFKNNLKLNFNLELITFIFNSS